MAEISRRNIAKGAAWSTPAIVIAAQAAQAAGSQTPRQQYSFTVTGTGHQQGTRTITIPKNATEVTYTVAGGGGGSYVSKFDNNAGSGALITGKLSLCGTSDVTLTLNAGGGGDQTGTVATGYGNGGAAHTLPVPPSNIYVKGQDIQSRAWGGGGGAGSALLLGSAPIVVAGGGGGDGVQTNSNDDAGYWQNSGTGGVGGTPTASGGTGTQVISRYNPGNITANPGLGASAATGGAAATGGTIGYATQYTRAIFDGVVGGNHGTGANGGGNGAAPSWRTFYTQPTWQSPRRYYHIGISSGAGGGGYAGGGSGGVTIGDSTAMFNTYATDGEYIPYALAGVGGPGGAGSNYTATTVSCVTNSSNAPVSANNASTTTSGVGKPGSVTVTYWA